MDTKRVKNVSGVTQSIIGVGTVAAGEVIEVPADFNNANFEEVEKKGAKNKDTKAA